MYSPAWPHSEIKEIFPDIFFVTGTNITHYNYTELQHSRNMITIRDNHKLALINTVRLEDPLLNKAHEFVEKTISPRIWRLRADLTQGLIVH